jgi:hypothetical protein
MSGYAAQYKKGQAPDVPLSQSAKLIVGQV